MALENLAGFTGYLVSRIRFTVIQADGQDQGEMAMREENQRHEDTGTEIERVPADLTSSPLIPTEPSPADSDAGAMVEDIVGSTPGVGGNLAEFARANHKYIREYIELADRKAAVVVTLGTALLAYLFERNLAELWLQPLDLWEITSGVAFVAMFAIAIAVLAALAVVVPRLKGTQDGLVFWRAISNFKASTQYADAAVAADDERQIRARLEHCYELATVCDRKYGTLNWSIRIGAVGLFASILYLLFFG